MKLVSLLEDFERLWLVAGFAERFSARLTVPSAPDEEPDPSEIVLAAHHTQLVDAVQQAQRRGEVPPERDAGLAHALVGTYLSRRLTRAPLDNWARDAIATVLRDNNRQGT